MRLTAARILAGLFALTWLVLPGFGLIDLSVTWDPDWPVVLEAGWGVFMTVLVGGSFLAVAVAPQRTAPAEATLLVALGTWLVAVVAGLEWPLLFLVGVLVVEGGVLAALLPDRERLRPLPVAVSWPLLVVGTLGVVPWLVYAADVLAGSRRGAGEIIGDVTMGVDHYAVQGALALAIPALALLAAVWPRGRRHLGVGAGLCAFYLGLVAYAFPTTWAGLERGWSVLCLLWALAVAALAWPADRSEPGELRSEVVEPQRAL